MGLAKLADGKITECPFSDELVAEGRELVFSMLESAGAVLPVRQRPKGQPFFLAALEEILRISGDPDYRAFYSSSVSFAKGVRLGHASRLPRVPAVFEKKTKWRRYAEDAEGQILRENYISAKQHAEMVQRQFLAEAELGAMEEMSLESAKAKFGKDLAVASLGAIEKKDGSYRVVHDGTHGVGVNARIKVRDQIRFPSAGDVQALLRELPGVFFGLTGDVKRAHRLVKIAMKDWGAQACRTGVPNADRVWVNKVGTFGVSSAAYHWARLMAGLGRSVYYLLGRAELALLIYVDDLLWLIRDKQALGLIPLVIFYLVVLGLPFAWKKFGGGSVLSWVGFEICLQSAKIGLSEQRARWLCRWLDDSVSTGRARIADVSAVLGRLSFGLTALGHCRPFLGPVYAWVASMDTGRVYLLPKAIILIFKFLAKALQGEGRLVSVSRHVTTPKELFRTDASAEGEEIWIGGWALDDADTRRCRWLSERLSHSNAPWLYDSMRLARPTARSRPWSWWQPWQQSLSLAFQRERLAPSAALLRRTTKATAESWHAC